MSDNIFPQVDYNKKDFNFPECTWDNTCFPMNTHQWSNMRGYGNIVTNQYNNKQVQQKISPFNRIQPLTLPTSTPAVIKDTWSPPISKELNNDIRVNCNICPPQSVTNYNTSCIYNYNTPQNLPNGCPRSTYKNDRVKYIPTSESMLFY